MSQEKPFFEVRSLSDTCSRGDYLVARAKRELERLLRADGYSKSEALRLVHDQFQSTDILKGNGECIPNK